MDVREYTETFPSALPARAGRRVPRLGVDRAGLRQRVHVLHRAARPRAAAVSPDRRRPRRGAGARRARRRRGHPARAEREHVRPRHDGARVVRAGRCSPSCCGRSNQVDGLRRIRFTSPHPHDFTPDVIDAMAEMRAVCEHIHFPLQSGSDRVLQGDAALVPARALPRVARAHPRGHPRHRGVDRHHRGVPRRDRGGLRGDPRRRRARRGSTARTCSSTRPGRARAPRRCRRPGAEGGRAGAVRAARRAAGARSRSSGTRAARSARRSRCSSRATAKKEARRRRERARTASCTSPSRSRRARSRTARVTEAAAAPPDGARSCAPRAAAV